MRSKTVTLDVREDIQKGREPFSKIMRAVYGLKNGEALRLIAPFEPLPLFSATVREGFSHKSRPTGTGDWEVLFQRVAVLEEIQEPPAPCLSGGGSANRSKRTGLTSAKARKVSSKVGA